MRLQAFKTCIEAGMRVLKLSGHELSAAESIRAMGRVVAGMAGDIVVVHGGGPLIDDLQTRLGQPIRKVQGLRVTDYDALIAALMVLCGRVNKQLVAAIVSEGMDAFGLSGIDAGLIKVRKHSFDDEDLGFVGEVDEVRGDLLSDLLELGITPVIAPLSLGTDGRIYNVNADQIAGAIAAALSADELLMVSNVPGVITKGRVLKRLNLDTALELINRGEIVGGMIPKVQAGIHVLQAGVSRVRIVDFDGLRTGGGTLIETSEPSIEHED
jgi:acetylglutamate kinase